MGLCIKEAKERGKKHKVTDTKVQSKGTAQQSPRPYDATLEPLVDILGGGAYVNVHCYEVG